jgi:ribosomal protein S15P/S13E
MREKTEVIPEEEWRRLEHQIRVFHEHVNAFQKDVEARLKPGKE